MKVDQKTVEQLKEARIDYKRQSSIIEMMEGNTVRAWIAKLKEEKLKPLENLIRQLERQTQSE